MDNSECNRQLLIRRTVLNTIAIEINAGMFLVKYIGRGCIGIGILFLLPLALQIIRTWAK